MRCSTPTRGRLWRLALTAVTFASLVALGVASPAQAQAQDAPQARSGPRNLFDVAYWLPKHRGSARFGSWGGSVGTTTEGDTFSLEQDLGLPRHSGGALLSYTHLIGVAWHFSADHVQSSRHGTVTTTRSLLLEGNTVPAGSQLQVHDRFSATTLAGGVALLQRGGTEWGVRIGGGVFRDHLRYERLGSGTTYSLADGDVAPLLGMFFSARPSETLQVDARADRLQIEDAYCTQLRFSLRWQANAHLGLEAGYVHVDGRTSPVDAPFEGSDVVRFTLSGPRLALRLAF